MDATFGVPEVVILVFQHCNGFRDAVALASTCKALASTWRLHFSSIIWPLAQVEIPGFSQALMAARATALVCDAFEANILPPDPFPLDQLSGMVRKPDLEDLKRVLDLRHLVRCVEQMYLEWDHASQLSHPERPENWSTMRNNFHTAMYRVLLAGAALTRPYLEPMFLAHTECPPNLIQRLHAADLGDSADLEYLERFPVYNLEASPDKWEPAFGHLARWLLDDIKTTAVRVETRKAYHPNSQDCVDKLNPDERGWLQEVIFLHAAYEHMIDKFFNQYIKDPADENLSTQDSVPPPFPNGVRDVSIAMFGIFRPENVSMPAVVEDASRCYLVNYPLGHESRDNTVLSQVSPWTTDTAFVLRVLQGESGRPNHRDGWPSAPPALRFVEFFMRKFFDVGFRHQVFEHGIRHLDYYIHGFLNRPDVFGDRSIMDMWILEKYKVPQLGYRHFD